MTTTEYIKFYAKEIARREESDHYAIRAHDAIALGDLDKAISILRGMDMPQATAQAIVIKATEIMDGLVKPNPDWTCSCGYHNPATEYYCQICGWRKL